jgi:hypothetical protein
MLFRKALKGVLVANVVGVCEALAHQIYEENLFRHQKNKYRSNSPEYLGRIAADVFTQMGVDLRKHPLRIVAMESADGEPIEKGCASIHEGLDGAYSLQVDLKSFERFQHKKQLPITRQDYFRAIFAHEAVHAIEKHNFYNIYISTIVTYTAMLMCEVMGMRLAAMMTVAPLLLFSTSCFVSRHFEYRADKVAASTDLRIRDALKNIFSIEESQTLSPYWGGIFRKHPTNNERLVALESSFS